MRQHKVMIRPPQKWKKVSINSHCLCPACHDHGTETKLNHIRSRDNGQQSDYECPTCGLLLRAVAVYRKPIDIQ